MNNAALNSKALTLGVALALGISISGHVSAQALPYNVDVTTDSDAHSSLSQALRLAAQDQLAIVLLGSDQFKYELGKHGVVDNIPSNVTRRIVIIESGSQKKNEMMAIMARGDYVITVGDSPADTTEAEFYTLFDIEMNGTAQKSLSEYKKAEVKPTADAGDGMVVGNSVAGYKFTPDGASDTYQTFEPNLVLALTRAVEWARHAEDEISVAQNQAKSAGTWDLRLSRNTDNNCNSGSTRAGIVSFRTEWRRLRESNTSKDWIEVKYKTVMQPNTGAGWRNGDITIYSPYKYRGANFELESHGPYTTQGTSSVGGSVDLGFSYSGGSGGAISAGRNWSYAIPDVVVSDYASYAGESVKWIHDVNQAQLVGRTTFVAEPGAVVRVPNGYASPWTKMYERYDAVFVTLNSRGNVLSRKVCTYTFF
ncbi:MAG: hypothetical protein R3F18_09575 [Lysobacterales bacterium]